MRTLNGDKSELIPAKWQSLKPKAKKQSYRVDYLKNGKFVLQQSNNYARIFKEAPSGANQQAAV